jgi:hypothetical protein
MSIADILGVLGFLLAVGLAALEIRSYLLPLQLRITMAHLVQTHKGVSLVSLLIAFVNPASRSRTVYHILTDIPHNTTLMTPPYQYRYDISHPMMEYKLPSGGNVLSIPIDELLQPPLDILPLQSQTKRCIIQTNLEHLMVGSTQIRLPLIAQDVFGRKVATFDKEIELRDYEPV